MPGKSVEGSSHETSFRFQQETEQLRTGKHKGSLVRTCLYTTLEVPNHGINVPNGYIMMEAHMRRTGLVDSIKAFMRLVESHAPLM